MSVCVSVYVSVCVCLSLRNLEIALFRFLLNPFAGKNLSSSDKILWRFLKKFLVAEKSQYKALSIGRNLKIFSLLLISAENSETLTLYLSKFDSWALSIIIKSCS